MRDGFVFNLQMICAMSLITVHRRKMSQSPITHSTIPPIFASESFSRKNVTPTSQQQQGCGSIE